MSYKLNVKYKATTARLLIDYKPTKSDAEKEKEIEFGLVSSDAGNKSNNNVNEEKTEEQEEDDSITGDGSSYASSAYTQNTHSNQTTTITQHPPNNNNILTSHNKNNNNSNNDIFYSEKHKHKYREIDARLVQVGDYIEVTRGNKLPCDGIVIEGESTIDESLITGESMPVRKVKGDEIIGATVNLSSTLIIQSTKVGQDTVLSKIITLVESAQASRAPVQQLADQLASYFVPLVVGISVAVSILW